MLFWYLCEHSLFVVSLLLSYLKKHFFSVFITTSEYDDVFVQKQTPSCFCPHRRFSWWCAGWSIFENLGHFPPKSFEWNVLVFVLWWLFCQCWLRRWCKLVNVPIKTLFLGSDESRIQSDFRFAVITFGDEWQNQRKVHSLTTLMWYVMDRHDNVDMYALAAF